MIESGDGKAALADLESTQLYEEILGGASTALAAE